MKKEILDKIIERAAEIWRVDASSLSADTQFADMNPKSVHYSQMTTYLEDAFDVEVPYMTFKRCKSFDEAAEFIADLLDE